ncbi:MAG: PAS domain S-box protein [Candidatus Omnitrophica bacterium]|nr:PAS domain S-box protein [Candidatus Omnitrophota bacterium]
MVSLREIFRDFFVQNLDVVFLIYGLSFVIMGISILAQPRRESIYKLSNIIWILAYFGIIHGINEWLHMVSIIQINEEYTSRTSYLLEIMQFALLTISYIFLFEFGRRLVLLSLNKKIFGKWITVFLCACTITAAFTYKQNWNIWPGYFIGFPGGVLSAFGFIKYYYSNKVVLKKINLNSYFLIAAVSICIYGMLRGIVVPMGDFFPAAVINTNSFLDKFGIPVQVPCAVCAIFLAWAVWNILGIFNWEIKQSLKTSLEEVSSAKANLDSIINSITDSLIIITVDGKIKRANPATTALLGYKEEKLIDKPISTVFMTEGSMFSNERLIELIEKGTLRSYEMVCKTESDNLIPVIFSASRVIGNDGKIEGIVVIIKDITERKRTEEALKNAYEQLKLYQSHLVEVEKLETVGILASGVAHEVKNPLAIILQGIEYLSKTIPQDEKNISLALRSVNDAILRADRVIKGLLDFSAMSEINISQEDVNLVIENSLLLVKNYITRHKIEVIMNLRKDIPPVNLDKNKVEQVLVNLFMNAIDAMPDGGILNIRTYVKELTEIKDGAGKRREDIFRLGEKAVIAEIEDSGQGIPESTLKKIFDPFFTTKRDKGGTGLGLSIARNIMDMHKGKIKIENRKEAKGTKATLIFKIKTEKGA